MLRRPASVPRQYLKDMRMRNAENGQLIFARVGQIQTLSQSRWEADSLAISKAWPIVISSFKKASAPGGMRSASRMRP